MIIYFTLGIIFMIGAIIITFISSFYEPESMVERISKKIANIIQILFLVGLLISYQTYVDTAKQNSLGQESILTEKGWVDVYSKISDSYNKCPKFCDSLGYTWQIPNTFTKAIKTDKDNDDYGTVLSLSILIFESFQSVITYFLYNYTTESLNEWLSSFIIWANSDILYEIWKNNRFIYDKSVQIFANTIFEEVRNFRDGSLSRPQDSSDITTLSSHICNSDVIKNIFKDVKKVPQCV